MSQRIRKRRILKWLGLTMCAAFGAAWIKSYNSNMGHLYLKWDLYIESGFVSWPVSESTASFWFSKPSFYRNTWLPQWHQRNLASLGSPVIANDIRLPFWLPIPPLLVATLWLWWKDRQPRSGCKKCGYNLTGNVSGTCPECGLGITVPKE